MTIAYMCLALAGAFPFVFAGVSKIGERSFDNNKPRDWITTQSGYRKRAYWVQLNSFEAFPLFAVGLFAAQLAGVRVDLITGLAVGFIVIRCAYAALYLADKASPRSMAWLLGILCTFGLYGAAIVYSLH